jgi:TPR repeat protein
MMAYFAHEGEGVPKNLHEAEDWAQKSAHQQDAFGEIMLGWMYENNEVAFQNPIISQSVIDDAYVQINRIRHEQVCRRFSNEVSSRPRTVLTRGR